MRKEATAHFDLVREQNRRIVRNLLRAESPLSIAQTAEKTGLSYPTVSALLKELAAAGEAAVSNEISVAGGRPGVCYELNPAYQYGLVLYFDDLTLKGRLYDAFGRSAKEYLWENITKQITAEDIVGFAKEVQWEFPALSAVSIGVPGVTFADEISYLPKFPKLVGGELSRQLTEELSAKVFLENDINAIALAEIGEWENFAHIVYVEEDECIGVGIVMQGQIVKGGQGYAGELEYLCRDRKDHMDTFTTSILALSCVLDLPDILLSGSFCTKENVEKIKERLLKRLPKERLPRLHVVDEVQARYSRGLFQKIVEEWSK